MADDVTPRGDDRAVPLPHRKGGLSSALQRRDHRTLGVADADQEPTPWDKACAERARRASSRRPSGLSASFIQASRGEQQATNFTSRPAAALPNGAPDLTVKPEQPPLVAPPEAVNVKPAEQLPDHDSARTPEDPGMPEDLRRDGNSAVIAPARPAAEEPAGVTTPRSHSSALQSRMIDHHIDDLRPSDQRWGQEFSAFAAGPTPQAYDQAEAVQLLPDSAFDDFDVAEAAQAPVEVDVLPTVFLREDSAKQPEDIVDAEFETGEIPTQVDIAEASERALSSAPISADAPFDTVAHSDQRAPITQENDSIDSKAALAPTPGNAPSAADEANDTDASRAASVADRRLDPSDFCDVIAASEASASADRNNEASLAVASTQASADRLTADSGRSGARPANAQPAQDQAPDTSSARNASSAATEPHQTQIVAPRRLRRHSIGEPIISLRNIKARYGRRKALSNVNLDVATGDILAVVGPPESGKSTVLNAMLGLVKVSSGKVLIDNVPVHGPIHDALISAQIAGVTPGLLAFPNLTVRENLAVAAVDGIPPGKVADEVLGYFPHLAEHADRPASELTRVDHVILSLAKILITNPRLIIIDDIAAGLSNMELDILEVLLRQIAATGTAIVLADRDPYAALQLSRRAVVVQEGRTVKSGRSADIYDLLMERHVVAD